jgi:small subunit ribosomal protein S5
MKDKNNQKEVNNSPEQKGFMSPGGDRSRGFNRGRKFGTRSRGFKKRDRGPSETLMIKRVSNTNKKGRICRSAFSAATGDGNGRLGIGRAKSQNFTDAARAAQRRSIKRQRSYSLDRRGGELNLTHIVTGHSNGTTVKLRPKYSGGRRCPAIIQKMLKVLGVKNGNAEIQGNASAYGNVIRATLDCLRQQEPDPEYAKKLGIPMHQLIKRKKANSYRVTYNSKAKEVKV